MKEVDRDLIIPNLSDKITPGESYSHTHLYEFNSLSIVFCLGMAEYYQSATTLLKSLQRALNKERDHRTISVPATSGVLNNIQIKLGELGLTPTKRTTQVVMYGMWTPAPSRTHAQPRSYGARPLTALSFFFDNEKWWKRWFKIHAQGGVVHSLHYIEPSDFVLILDYGHQVNVW